jgi:HAD superfamily hydrolase (TIGR01509 family)
VTISHIIFDCDGVLVDSEPLSMRADVEILKRFGIEMTETEAHRRFVGRTFEAMLKELSAQRGTVFPDGLLDAKNKRLAELYRSELKLVRGVRDALESIRNLGLTMSIASNSPRERVKLALQLTGLLGYFKDNIVTFEDVPHGKPAPDVFLLAAKKAGVKAGDCLVVEDSITGVTAAVDAGCWTLGFTGTHDEEDAHGAKLKDIGAEALFGKMADLPALVSTFVLEN